MTKDIAFNETKKPDLYVSFILIMRDIFNYQKRLGRADFWWATLTGLLLNLALLTSFFRSLATATFVPGPIEIITVISAVLLVILDICYGLAKISATVRRLHDIGLSGAYYFLYFIPAIGTIIVLILTCLPSKQVGNRYIEKYKTEGPLIEESTKNQKQSSNLDELIELKKLLDSGVITQKDFDTKKKQILGL